MSSIKAGLILGGAGLLVGAGTLYFGLIHPGADEPHSAVVYKLIETARNRAIAVRADDVTVPALTDPAMIKQGAGNYAAMCTGCHLAPGIESTEMSMTLYPAPPNLVKLGAPDPARAFWVIKHGIKASGMGAWGKSINDQYIWNMVAFLQQLPKLTTEEYKKLVAESGGHSHGGGETMPASQGKMEGMSHDDGGMAGMKHDEAGMAEMNETGSKPAVDESKPHGHAAGAGHDEAKPVAKPPVDESKPHDHAAGSEH